jgi:hypothetical protein
MMGILDETRFVERLQFFNGQRLFASDLQGIEAFHREMRWLHNRSLHQAGIGNGFAVTGERDAREIRIGPGYALDSLGREIVLTHEQVEPIPPVAGETDGQSVFFDLVVSYDDEPETAETRQGICLPRGVVRLREEPLLCFVRLQRDQNGNLQVVDPRLHQEILDGLRVVLARLEVIDCRLRKTISLAQRRSARPACMPYLACGEVEVKFASILDDLFHLHQLIDTTSAGFQTTPCYSVRLVGQRLQLQDDNNGTSNQEIDYFILDGSAQVLEANARSFVVDAIVEVQGPNPPTDLTGWKAVWMGVE